MSHSRSEPTSTAPPGVLWTLTLTLTLIWKDDLILSPGDVEMLRGALADEPFPEQVAMSRMGTKDSTDTVVAYKSDKLQAMLDLIKDPNPNPKSLTLTLIGRPC